jgi:hypothetical protein
MKHRNVTHGTKATAGSTAVPGLLESEIADLKELNAHLKRRLEEAELDAELQVRADRILAIPHPMDA